MISVEALVKYYGPKLAVDNASFAVKAGETVGLLGPNGAGKTTMIRIITGLFPPSSGQVRIDGLSIIEQPLEFKRRIGYLPEMSPVYLDMPVERYLRFVAEMKGIPRGRWIEHVEEVVESCGLKDVLGRLAGRLSKGYRQRLGLAQALLNNPPVIVLDEPTIGLDPAQTFEFRRLIRGLKGERTILLSTHVLPEVSMICDRLIIMNKGRIIAQDSPDGLEKRLRKRTDLIVGVDGPDKAVREKLSGIRGVRNVTTMKTDPHHGTHYCLESDPDTDPRQEVVGIVVAHGWKLLELSPVRMGLEEVFMNLVTEEEST